MHKKKIAESGNHCWWFIGRDPDKSPAVIDTNEFLIISDNDALMTDPGGYELFPSVVRAASEIIDITQISKFYCSHQDPDIMSSLPLWMGLCAKSKIYMPWIWTSFIAHFGHEYVESFVSIPDEGMSIPIGIGERSVQLIPAHYLHSSGTFSLYDPAVKLLFTGDIGAALLPPNETGLYVEDFDKHIRYMEKFHRRWMPSNRAKNNWISRVRKLDIDMLCPQHGALFRGENIGRFFDWLENLDVGSAM